MTDFLNEKSEPNGPIPWTQPNGISNAASQTFNANEMLFQNTSGNAVPWSADPTLVCVGSNRKAYASNSTVGAYKVEAEYGAFDYDNETGANALTDADRFHPCYASSGTKVSRTNKGNTLPVAGVFLGLWTRPGTSAARAIVLLGGQQTPFLASGVGAQTPFYARAVITSIAAYAASNGVLTASATGAIGAQDGVTLAAGDVVLLPAYQGGAASVAASDAGPYVVTAVGDGSTKYVLTRPSWWPTAGGIPQGVAISVGGEGTVWAGSTWKALCAKGKIVDTDDPTIYPAQHKGTGAVGTQVTHLFAAPAAIATAVDATAAAAVARSDRFRNVRRSVGMG